MEQWKLLKKTKKTKNKKTKKGRDRIKLIFFNKVDLTYIINKTIYQIN